MQTRWIKCWVAAIGLPSVAVAQPDGFDWVTVGAPGNAPYTGLDPENLVTGRGSVGYEFRIGRTEVTTAQFMEFQNTFTARANPLSTEIIGQPTWWGASLDQTYPGPGYRYRLSTSPGSDMRPVAGLDWRVAARFCNWLHNGKSSDPASLNSGAYDTSTFGYTPDGIFTDQLTRSPGARYWIPSLDEWMKAAHYDPNRNGPGLGGYWAYPHMSDSPPIYAPPPEFGGGGTGQANSGFRINQADHWLIPLGSYPTAQSPWGLLDAAGATMEWTEGDRMAAGFRRRILDGSFAGSTTGVGGDLIYAYGDAFPDVSLSFFGMRIASEVPSPAVSVVLAGGLSISGRRRRSRR